MRFGDGANHSFDLFTDFVFISKNDIQLPIMYETKTKKFDIITPENICYRWLLKSIFRDVVYQQKKSIYPFCYNYKNIIDKKKDCDRKYIFSFISIYDKGNNLDYKTIFYIKNLYYDKHETDILFNQYQNLKNQKNKINFNSQGEVMKLDINLGSKFD